MDQEIIFKKEEKIGVIFQKQQNREILFNQPSTVWERDTWNNTHTHTHTHTVCVCVCVEEHLAEIIETIDRSSISSRIIPKTLKMALDASLLNTQYY